MSKKVCMLVTGHPTLDDRIFYKEAKSLHNAGFDVSMICPLNKNGCLTDMGGNPIAKDEANIDGINIIGFKTKTDSIFHIPKTSRISYWLRLLTLRNLKLISNPFVEMIKKGLLQDADVYHCHEPESLYVGIIIKRMLQKKSKNPKLICDMHEFWPAKNSGRLIKDNINALVTESFQKKAFSYIDYIITVNQIIRGYLLYLDHSIKTEVLYNSPSLSIFTEMKRNDDQDQILICHEGSLTFDRGLKEIIEVAYKLNTLYGEKVRFQIIGNIPLKEKEYIEQKFRDYQINQSINMTGWLPYENVGKAISECSIGIILMDTKLSENNFFSSPNKLFNYMRYGLPIVTADLPEIRRIVLESKCGIVIKKRTVEAFTEALSLLINNKDMRIRLGENGRKAIYEKYGWNIMEKKLLNIYNELFSNSVYISPIAE